MRPELRPHAAKDTSVKFDSLPSHAQRVLLVHNHYRLPGGEDTVFEAEARALREYGVDVFVEELFTPDIPTSIGILGRARLASNTVWSRDAAGRIAALVRRHAIDVVHFHNTFPLVSPAAYRAAGRAGAAVVQTLHNYRPVCAAATLMRDGKPCEDCVGRRVGWPAVLNRCYQGSVSKTVTLVAMQTLHRVAGTWNDEVDVYLALTEFQRERFIAAGFPSDRVEVKPNFVDFTPPIPSEGRRDIVFVGRLSEAKGLHTLFDAWEQIPAGHHLTVVGDGPLGPELRERARAIPSVTMTGQLEAAWVRKLMAGATAVVVPSIWYEGQPMVVLEAFACGTPVIASRVGALKELVREGETGWLATPGDARDLAAVMLQALTHRPPDAMEEACRREVEEKFAKAANVRLLLGAYTRAMDRRAMTSGSISEQE